MLRLGLELSHHVETAKTPGAARRQPFRGEHISLHLGKRDMTFGKSAVGVEDGVEGVLPALIGKPELAGAPVLDKAVIVGVAGTIDPLQRRLDRRPELREQFLIAGALDIEARQQDEQRSGIDAAVILRKRYFAQRRHLAAA